MPTARQVPNPRRTAPALSAAALAAVLAAACGGGGAPAPAPADATAAGAATAPAPGGTAGVATAPTSLNPGASLRRDTTGAPYDATAADSVQRRVAAEATGHTDPAIIGENSGMGLPSNVPISQVGAGPTATQRDGGGDRFRGPAATAWVDAQGRTHYTDAAGRELSDDEINARTITRAVANPGVIATGAVEAYQPNAMDAPGAAARGATSALSAAGAVDRNEAWGGASAEVAAKLERGTAVAPTAPAAGDSARPASPGGPINAAVPNAVLVPTAANARAIITLINSAEIEAGRIAEERASTPSLRQFAAQIRREHEARTAELEEVGGPIRLAALSQAQRDAIGTALSEQRTSLTSLDRGSPNFDTQWISAQVAAHEKALTDLRTLAPLVTQPPLRAYVTRLTAGVEAHLQQAQRLQTRPGTGR